MSRAETADRSSAVEPPPTVFEPLAPRAPRPRLLRPEVPSRLRVVLRPEIAEKVHFFATANQT